MTDTEEQSGTCTSDTQQIRLSNSDRPQRARDARALRERARHFKAAHEDRLSFWPGEKRLFGSVHPFLAASSVWRNPLDDGAEARLNWAERTHHAILADEEPEWDYCPRCGEVLPS